MADAPGAEAAEAAAAAMEVVAGDSGGGSARNSVEMPLATELTAGVAGMGDGGPEEVGGLACSWVALCVSAGGCVAHPT